MVNEKYNENKQMVDEKNKQKERNQRLKTKLDMDCKKENHQKYLQSVQDQILMNAMEKDMMFRQNQKVIHQKDQQRYERLDDKNRRLGNNLNTMNYEKQKVQDNVLSLKKNMIRDNVQKDRIMEQMNKRQK